MASRSPAIFLLLALPLLCYVVSTGAHTLPDDIVRDSRGLSNAVVPESRLTTDLEVADESPAKLAALQQNSEGHLQAQATQGLNDGLIQSRMRKGGWGLTQVTEGQTDDDELEEELLDELLDRRRKGQYAYGGGYVRTAAAT